MPGFRSASFRPPQSTGPTLEVRTDLAEKLGHLIGSKPPIAVEGLAKAIRDRFLDLGEICTKVESTLRGAALRIPDAVTRTGELVARLRAANDDEVVSTAHGAWADLRSGEQTVKELAAVLESDLETLRRAAGLVAGGSEALGNDYSEDLARLADVLEAGDYAANRGLIRALADRLDASRRERSKALADDIRNHLASERERIRARFPAIDRDKLNHVIRQLEELEPPANSQTASPAMLCAKLDAIEGRTRNVVRILEEVEAAGRLARIDVAEIVGKPIRSEEELENALGRIREAVAAAVAEGKEVRLR